MTHAHSVGSDPSRAAALQCDRQARRVRKSLTGIPVQTKAHYQVIVAATVGTPNLEIP
jgi:hypothetical protein